MKKNIWIQLLLFLLILFMVQQFYSSFASFRKQRIEISYTIFKEKVAASLVKEVMIKGEKITGEFTETLAEIPTVDGQIARGAQFFLSYLPPIDDASLFTLLAEKRVIINVKPTERHSWMTVAFANALPFLLLIGIWWYMARRMRGEGGGGIFDVGKSRATLYTKEMSQVRFADVAGLENPKQEVQEIVDFLKNPGQFRKLGATIPKGILLMGPPGTGKTLLAKAVAGEANVPFFSASGSEFVEMLVGVGASRVRDLFEKAKKATPSIVFIDEIDAVGRSRGAGLGGGHDEREQTLNQLLAEMDGFDPYEGVVVIGATNRPDVLDSALLRPGRFDRRIVTENPALKARVEVLEIHSRNKPLADDVDLETIARGTPGLSAADLENLLNEAAIYAVRGEAETITMEHLEMARDKILLGEKRDDILIDRERELVAFHEAGHAVVAAIHQQADPIYKVSIVPRGLVLGVTQQLPKDERHNFSRSYLEGRITVLLGGRAAEELFMDDISSGGEDDFQEVTDLARRMICQWGFSDKLGVMSVHHESENVFLGREIARDRNISEETTDIIDEELHRILHSCHEQAREILQANEPLVREIAATLLEKESLGKEELDTILKIHLQKQEKRRFLREV